MTALPQHLSVYICSGEVGNEIGGLDASGSLAEPGISEIICSLEALGAERREEILLNVHVIGSLEMGELPEFKDAVMQRDPTHSRLEDMDVALRQDKSSTIVLYQPGQKHLRVAINSGVKFVAVLSESFNRPGLLPLIQRRLLVSLLNKENVELVAANGHASLRRMTACGVDAKKSIAWSYKNLSRTPLFAPRRLRSLGAFNVSVVTRTSQGEGGRILERVIRGIKRHVPDVKLNILVAAAKSQNRSSIEERQLTYKLNDLVEDSNQRLIDSLTGSDCLVLLPSKDDGDRIPFGMEQSLSSRVPVVTVRSPMIDLVFHDGLNCLKATSPSNIGQKVGKLLSEEHIYNQLSDASQITLSKVSSPITLTELLAGISTCDLDISRFTHQHTQRLSSAPNPALWHGINTKYM